MSCNDRTGLAVPGSDMPGMGAAPVRMSMAGAGAGGGQAYGRL